MTRARSLVAASLVVLMVGSAVSFYVVDRTAPEQFVSEAPFQLAILMLEGGKKITGRILGERVTIGDSVDFVEDFAHRRDAHSAAEVRVLDFDLRLRPRGDAQRQHQRDARQLGQQRTPHARFDE